MRNIAISIFILISGISNLISDTSVPYGTYMCEAWKQVVKENGEVTKTLDSTYVGDDDVILKVDYSPDRIKLQEFNKNTGRSSSFIITTYDVVKKSSPIIYDLLGHLEYVAVMFKDESDHILFATTDTENISTLNSGTIKQITYNYYSCKHPQ